MEEKDVVEDEENEDVGEKVMIAGSVVCRERELDTVGCDAGGVSTKGSSAGAIS